MESEPAYQYVRGNVVNWTDASGNAPSCDAPSKCGLAPSGWKWEQIALKNPSRSDRTFELTRYRTENERNYPIVSSDDVVVLIFDRGRYISMSESDYNRLSYKLQGPIRKIRRDFFDAITVQGTAKVYQYSDGTYTDDYKGLLSFDTTTSKVVGEAKFYRPDDPTCVPTANLDCAVTAKTGAVIGGATAEEAPGNLDNYKDREDMGIALYASNVPPGEEPPGTHGKGTMVCIEGLTGSIGKNNWIVLNDKGKGVGKPPHLRDQIDVYSGIQGEEEFKPASGFSLVWRLVKE